MKYPTICGEKQKGAYSVLIILLFKIISGDLPMMTSLCEHEPMPGFIIVPS